MGHLSNSGLDGFKGKVHGIYDISTRLGKSIDSPSMERIWIIERSRSDLILANSSNSISFRVIVELPKWVLDDWMVPSLVLPLLAVAERDFERLKLKSLWGLAIQPSVNLLRLLIHLREDVAEALCSVEHLWCASRDHPPPKHLWVSA